MRTHLAARPGWRSVFLCLLVSTCSQPAAAQGIAGSFEQLQLLVRPGDTVTLTDTSGREATGKIADLTSSMLVLMEKGSRRELSEREVTTIRQRRSDSLANGAIWGLAVGGLLATGMVAAFWEGDDDIGPAAVGVALYSGVGAGIGAGVDALITRRHVIYQRRSTSAVEIGIVPLMTDQRKGALVSVRF